MRVIHTRYGARLMEGKTVLSKVLSRPGPVHDIYDVMAVCLAELSPGPRICLLGFAGGEIVAPVRATGCRHPIRAVDLSRQGEGLFRRLSSSWCGTVRLTQGEASAWLRRGKTRFDLIVEDLGVNLPDGPAKPPVSTEVLPRLIRRRLSPRGVAVINALPAAGMSWKELLDRLAKPFPEARTILFEDYENRLVIGSSRLPGAGEISLRVRAALRRMGSRMTSRIRVHTLREFPARKRSRR